MARPAPVAALGIALVVLACALVGTRALRSAAVPALVLAVVAAGLSAHAWAGLRPPPTQRFVGDVTLVTDPEIVPGGLRMEVVADGRHSQLRVGADLERGLRDAMAGEQVAVVGWLEPVRGDPWLARRHIASRITASNVGPVRTANVATQLANDIRRFIQDGADYLGDDERGLYLGLVLGDDRGQSDATVDAFRNAGLTHLLVVSGQNVAFVLAVASPVLGRLQLRSRLVATIAVIAFFALVTRFEPSVLRAATMVGLTAITATLGRPTSRLRVLAYTATICLLIDPFLVLSVGFGLSLSACAGIILLAPPIGGRLPGPAFVREPLAVTLAAEIGVAPLLIATFDGVPLASVPANLLAETAAGFVMSWGMSVGLVVGFLPAGLGRLLMAPAGIAVTWIAGVANWAANLPLGRIDGRSGVALVVLVVALAGVRSRSRRRPSDPAARRSGVDV